MFKVSCAVLFIAVVLGGTSAGLAAPILVTWHSNPLDANGSVGSNVLTMYGVFGAESAPVTPDPNTPQIIFSGFDANGAAHTLYQKNNGSDEHGLGLVGTNDNELTLTPSGTAFANYIQIYIGGALDAGYDANLMIRVQSVTLNSPGDQEAFDVWGSNSPNTFTTKLISGNTTNDTFVTVPMDGNSYYQYLFLTTTPNPDGNDDNVLMDDIQLVNPGVGVPEPASMVLLAVGGGLALIRRRGRK